MKYMGSKAKIAEEILSIMLQYRQNEQYFVDLFCGGCNLLDKVNGKRIGNDANTYLIAMWKGLQNNVIDFPTNIPKSLYDEWRDFYNKTKKIKVNLDELDKETFEQYALCGWIGFMGSFNGRFYDGGYSGHNVKTTENGKARDYISEQIKNTLSQVEKLKDVHFVNGSYETIEIPKNSVIYCDIPYVNTKQYTISKDFDYEKFYDFCRKKAREGFRVFVSEYWMPDDFKCVWQKEVTNAMNPKLTKKPIEKLYTIDF